MTTLRAISIHVEFYFRGLWNWRTIMYGDLLQPIIYLIFLAAGMQNVVGNININENISVPYMAFAFSGLIGLIAFRSWPSITFSVANDRKWGTFALKILNGYTPFQYIISTSVVGILLFVSQAGLLLIMGLILGIRFSISNILMCLLMSVCSVTFWAVIGTAIATFVQNYQQRGLIITLTTLPMVFAAPIFYPLENIPLYLKIIAHINPLTYHVNSIRSALFGSLDLVNASVVIIAMIIAIFFGIWCVSKAEVLSKEW
ncbi:ABC transporter permease [Lederbergia ruris]|uniref:ABC transporter permease n=1 Tax=Lederbergia ruris TaxID=217495 RepID=UPI00399F8ADB